MCHSSRYLYDNAQPDAESRLKGLEAVEDENSISLLDQTSLEGSVCIDIGAGAGSIADWLASRVGPSGSVTASDIEPKHLSGSGYEVLQHDVEKEELPSSHYDLVHIRHVLIHLADPVKAIRNVVSSLKQSGIILIEESDLSTWRSEGSTPELLQKVFQNGVEVIFSVYKSRGMNIRLGSELTTLLGEAGMTVTGHKVFKRHVIGGSSEAVYQSKSMSQLARATGRGHSDYASIKRFADCLLNPELRYQSRTTVSVTAEKRK